MTDDITQTAKHITTLAKKISKTNGITFQEAIEILKIEALWNIQNNL